MGPRPKEAIIEMCSNLKWHKKQRGAEGKRKQQKAKAQQLPRQSARTYGPNVAHVARTAVGQNDFQPRSIPSSLYIYFMLCLFDLKLVGRRLGSGLSSGRANINISSQ